MTADASPHRYRPDRLVHAPLRHEQCHLQQIKRDGRLWFALKYSWLTLRYGYWNNPYEIKARQAESKP